MKTDTTPDLQTPADRRAVERRGWIITASGVVGIVAVTALLAVAISAVKDDGSGAAAGGGRTYRSVTTGSFVIPGGGKFDFRVESTVDVDRGLALVIAEVPDFSGGSPEPVRQEYVVTPTHIYARLGAGFEAPADVPAEKEWLRFTKDQTETILGPSAGILDPASQDPATYYETIKAIAERDDAKGTETVPGGRATLHEISVGAAEYLTATGGEITGISGEEKLSLRVWVGSDGFTHRIAFPIPGGGEGSEVVTDYLDYGKGVTIEIPAQAKVHDASAIPTPQQTSTTFSCTGQVGGDATQNPDC